MATFRSAAIVIVFGLFAIACAVVAIARPDHGYAMPPKSGAPTPGTYSVIAATDIVWRAARQPSYTPSQNLRAQIAPQDMQNEGVTRHWYTYAARSHPGPKPLVLLFHGAERSGLSMIEMWRETADRNGLVLVAPDAHLGRWPVSRPNPGFLSQLIDETAATHNIDFDQIYLFGHSNGGRYVQIMLNRAQGPWKSAAAHAGYLPPEFFVPASNPKPFRLYLGTRDHLFPLSEADQLMSGYAEIGHDTSLVVIENHNHWFYEIGPEIAAASWRWFQSNL